VPPHRITPLGSAPQLGTGCTCAKLHFSTYQTKNNIMSIKATGLDKAIKVLHVSSPSLLIENGNHKATIMSDAIEVFTTKTKKDEPLQIVSIKVQIDGFSPFSAAIITEDVTKFLKEKSQDDEIQVSVTTNDKGYKQAQI
jgi:hypothetical protein